MSDKYEQIKPKCGLKDIELSEKLRGSIDEMLEDRKFSFALSDEGLKPRKLVLLYGPPGCGKTSIAHGLAHESGLPLFLASGAQIVSMFVGEAEKAAESIFKFTEKEDCIMLIDEFEGLAPDRRHAADHSHRLVNTFLVNMETRVPLGITVCCTNYKELIDAAILRRFDLILEVPPLSRESLVKVAEAIIKGRHGITAEDCLRVANTPSGIVREAKNRLRSAIIDAERKNPRPIPKAPDPVVVVQQPRLSLGVPVTYGKMVSAVRSKNPFIAYVSDVEAAEDAQAQFFAAQKKTPTSPNSQP